MLMLAQDEVKRTLAALQQVVRACGYAWDGVCLALAMPQSLRPDIGVAAPEEWEDVCRALGFEYVDYEQRGRNDYGGLFLFVRYFGSGGGG